MNLNNLFRAIETLFWLTITSTAIFVLVSTFISNNSIEIGVLMIQYAFSFVFLILASVIVTVVSYNFLKIRFDIGDFILFIVIIELHIYILIGRVFAVDKWIDLNFAKIYFPVIFFTCVGIISIHRITKKKVK